MLAKLGSLVDKLNRVILSIAGESRRLKERSMPIFYLVDEPFSYNEKGDLEYPMKEVK